MLNDITYMWNIKYDTNALIYKTDTGSQRSDLWLPRGRDGGKRLDWELTVSRWNWLFLVAQSVKSLPEKQETQVQFLGQEGTLEKEMATHSSILAWRIPRTEEPGRLQSMV